MRQDHRLMGETLQDLVERAIIKRNVRSGRALAALAQEHGFQVDHTQLNGIRRGTYRHQPKTQTVQAIAWLAGVSERRAWLAAGRVPPGRPFSEELPADVDRLTPTQRRMVLQLIRSLLGEIVEEPPDGADDETSDEAISGRDMPMRKRVSREPPSTPPAPNRRRKTG